MTIKQFLIACIFSILIFTSARSQSHCFGKITEDEWNMEKCSFDLAARAVILFDEGIISVRTREGEVNIDPYCKLQPKFFRTVFERHRRVKILHKEGIETGSLSVTIQSVDGKKVDLTHFKCISVHKENGKEIIQKFALKNLSDSVTNSGGLALTIMLPETQDGSIVDLSYTMEAGLTDKVPEWNFSDEFPTLYSQIKFNFPDFFQRQKKCSIDDKLIYECFRKSEIFNVSYTSSTNGTLTYAYSFYMNNEEYSINNIPALPKTEVPYKLHNQFPAFNFSSVPYKSYKVASIKRGPTSLGFGR